VPEHHAKSCRSVAHADAPTIANATTMQPASATIGSRGLSMSSKRFAAGWARPNGVFSASPYATIVITDAPSAA